MRWTTFAVCMCLLASVAGPLRAAPIDDFNAAVAASYGPYRAASNYLRTGNPGLASLELGDALSAWQAVPKSPPPPVGKDNAYAADIGKIQAALTQGLSLADAGDASGALKIIEPVRGMLYDLRKRNGIVTYADCITELNLQMDQLFRFRRPTPEVKNPAIAAEIKVEAKRYGEILERCRNMAGPEIRDDAEFTRLFDGTRESAASLNPAADRSGEAVVNVLRELRSFDRIIYFRFGG